MRVNHFVVLSLFIALIAGTGIGVVGTLLFQAAQETVEVHGAYQSAMETMNRNNAEAARLEKELAQ